MVHLMELFSMILPVMLIKVEAREKIPMDFIAVQKELEFLWICLLSRKKTIDGNYVKMDKKSVPDDMVFMQKLSGTVKTTGRWVLHLKRLLLPFAKLLKATG
ncbi:hypothetical protein SETIT_5G169100v2 [Setaria italica]|uniref:Uncharacterized protein n=1 Tax=Setaria italica TaxID=4555 RepID=A0A368R5I4_SETIT|nr:hypothetical protein SETIT_5G169100v2 [Setaria italica]